MEYSIPREENALYFLNQEFLTRYRQYKLSPQEESLVIDFNHASFVRPYIEVHNAVQIAQLPDDLERRVRQYAASLVRLKDSSRVLFTRNTTEALSFTYWIGNVEGGNVVTTDAANPSIPRIHREHRDHGNTKGTDVWSTFPDDDAREDFDGIDKIIKTEVEVREVNFLSKYNFNGILTAIDENTKLVVIDHIVRHDGYIVDVIGLAKQIKAKSPDVYIAVDGAQALGNIPNIDFSIMEEAGVDFYAATPHKTLGSKPLGILYVSERAIKNIKALGGKAPYEQIIMQGMIASEHGIAPNVYSSSQPKKLVELHGRRLLGLAAAIEKLRRENYNHGNNFSNKVGYISQLKDYFVRKLKEYDVEILSEGVLYSPAILSFRLRGKNSQEVVMGLQSNYVLCSYLSKLNNIRVSFDITNTAEQIDRFFQVLEQITTKS